MNRRLALALIAACFGALFAQCSAGPCSCPDGCCDSKGVCRSGTDHWYCGGGGAACVTCEQGHTCGDDRACHRAVVTNGTGGGSGGGPGGSGGSGGSGGGGQITCQSIAAWPTQHSSAGYYQSFGGLDVSYGLLDTGDPNNPPGGSYDELDLEVFWDFLDGGAPYSATFSSADTWGNCATCLLAYTGCDAGGDCGGPWYFAQSGSVTVNAATRNRDAGIFNAAATDVTLVEWDFAADEAVPGGSCITLGSAVWNISWDGGS